MRARYDAVVVGSGFGGAVAACRLAQAGQTVAVLERGRRYAATDFPVQVTGSSTFWEPQRGLFDVRLLGDMMVVQSAGYGGGSLIYANVHLRPPPSVFAAHWPSGWDRAALDPYYDLVGYMLDVVPITQAPCQPTKTERMREAAAALGRSAELLYPPLAVRFEAAPDSRNKFGVPQGACVQCGLCDVGCPRHAKNTLDLNYLAVAEQKGAEVGTGCEVTRLAPIADGYRVSYRDDADGEQAIEAGAVFLCAGAVNTTELLLRCRDQHRTLPRLSEALGRRYSGNGDALLFGLGARVELDPHDGPTITTALRYDGGGDGDPRRPWFLIEEGGYPHLEVLLSALDRYRGELGFDRERGLAGQLSLPPRAVNAVTLDDRRSAVFLAMGRDDASGRLELSAGDHLRLRWDAAANLPLYQTEERLAADLADSWGATLVSNPLWHYLRKPVSVHSLGGCAMAQSPADGVVDPQGEVHGYPGLFVLDGAAVPVATGVNPSATIAAMAERNIERFVQRTQPGWQAPERRLAVPLPDPLAAMPPPPSKEPETPQVGVRFRETMTGFYTPGVVPPPHFDEALYLRAEADGRANGRVIEFTLDILMPNIEDADPSRTAADGAASRLAVPATDQGGLSGLAKGRLRVDGLTPPEGAEVVSGSFALFTRPAEKIGSGPERRMLYALPFVGQDGHSYLLDGFKVVRDDGSFDVWRATSTLFTVIRRGHSHQDPVFGSGVVRIRPRDFFLHQLGSMRVVGQAGLVARARYGAAFARFFFGTLWEVFVSPRLPHDLPRSAS